MPFQSEHLLIEPKYLTISFFAYPSLGIGCFIHFKSNIQHDALLSGDKISKIPRALKDKMNMIGTSKIRELTCQCQYLSEYLKFTFKYIFGYLDWVDNGN